MDKKLAEAKMKLIYRERLKRFLGLTAKIRNQRAIKTLSKHLREIDEIYYELDEYRNDSDKKQNFYKGPIKLNAYIEENKEKWNTVNPRRAREAGYGVSLTYTEFFICL